MLRGSNTAITRPYVFTPPPPPPPPPPDPPTPPTYGALLPARIGASTGTVTNVTSVATANTALGAATNGDIINFTSNVNGAGAIWTISRTAAAGAPITVTCSPGVTLTNFAQIIVTGTYIRLLNLNISAYTVDGIKITGAANHVEVDGCTVHDSANPSGTLGQGILVTSSAQNLQLWNNRVYNSGNTGNGNKDHGMYFSYARGSCVIANNLVYDCAAYSMQLYPDAGGLIVVHNTLDGGTLHANQRGGFITGSDSGLTDNVLMVGNISTNAPGGPGFSIYDPTSGDTNNNCYDAIGFGNSGGSFQAGGGFTYTNCSTANPLYTDRTAKDYTLGSLSPAISKIDISRFGYVPPLDRNGNTRITADAGCYRK